MDLIKLVVKRSKFSDIAYVVLNALLAVLVLVLTIAYQPPILAYLLVVLSKWRVLAVRPRFWWANFQTNLVDVLVGVSVVTLIWQASGVILAQVLLAVLYVAWLLILKPRSDRRAMVMQAGISQFLSLTALFSAAYYTDASIVVMSCFVIGYVSARHVLMAYDDEGMTLLCMIWGLFLAELGWLSYHWTTAYTVAANLLLPQIAIIASLLAYVTTQFYDAQHDGDDIAKRLKAPLLFAGAVIAVLMFSEMSAIFKYTS